jgi:GrpB-like predicted nucleotidyltransferase (UPF0157 family)
MRNEFNSASSDSGDRLKRVTLGEPTVLDGPVTLREYDPEWREQFVREAERIRSALGTRALRIEHVGSTSVLGLIAKPVIDILLVVEDSADEPAYVPALNAAGYVLRIREPEWHEHRMFKGTGIDLNLHVFTVGSVEIKRLLLLRDRLRGDPAERELYAGNACRTTRMLSLMSLRRSSGGHEAWTECSRHGSGWCPLSLAKFSVFFRVARKSDEVSIFIRLQTSHLRACRAAAFYP